MARENIGLGVFFEKDCQLVLSAVLEEREAGNSRSNDKKDLAGNKDCQIMDIIRLDRDLSHGKPHCEE